MRDNPARTEEVLWTDFLQRVCRKRNLSDHVRGERGIVSIRALLEEFLERFPMLRLTDKPREAHSLDSVRVLCETILNEVAWEEERQKVNRERD